MNSTNEKKNPSSEATVAVKPTPVSLVPPDGGYGWVVVLANCLLMFVNSSVAYCFGIVYVYLVGIGYTNTQVAVVPALMNAVTNIHAPVSTALSRYYSHRRLVMIGIIAMSLGLFLCTFSTHIVWFYVCYGVILGWGNSFIASQGFLLSQKYFTTKRVAANAISMAGGSIGFMVVPMLLTHLVEEYSNSGSFIPWSGVVLQGLIGASLFHPVQWHLKPSKTIPMQVFKSKNASPETINDSSARELSEEESLVFQRSNEHGSGTQAPVCNEPAGQDSRVEESVILSSPNHAILPCGNDENEIGDTIESSRILRKEVNKRRSHQSLANDIFGSTLSVKIENLKMQEEENARSVKNAEAPPKDDHYVCCGIILPKLNDIINFKLFKYPAFCISAFSSICNRMVYLCFVTYLPAVVLDAEVGVNPSYFLMIVAVFELVSKITISFISDLGFMPRRYFLIIAAFTGCCSNFSVAFANGFWSLALSCAGYGLSVGVMMCVGPVLLVEYLGLKLLPYSYGLLLFMNGLGGLAIFSITGFLNDLAGNYTTTYLGLSALSILPAILWSLINRCQRSNPPELD